MSRLDEQKPTTRHVPDPGASSTVLRSALSGVLWALLCSVAVAAIVAMLKYTWVNHGLKKPGPDGTVLLSTFITLYGLFLGGFGVLGGFLRKSSHSRLQVMAITLMVEATFLDLFRVLNSTEDLYATTVRKLTFFQLHDDMHDFLIYFSLNLAVSAFVLLVAIWPAAVTGSTTASSAAASKTG